MATPEDPCLADEVEMESNEFQQVADGLITDPVLGLRMLMSSRVSLGRRRACDGL